MNILPYKSETNEISLYETATLEYNNINSS